MGGAGRGLGLEAAELVTWKQMRIHGGGVDRQRRNQVCDIQKPKEKLLQWLSVLFYRWNSINMSGFLLMYLFMFRPDSLVVMQDVKFIALGLQDS